MSAPRTTTRDTPDPALPGEDQLFRLLRQLDRAPDAVPARHGPGARRQSLGTLNAHLRAVTAAGYVRVTDRAGPDRRSRVAYALTPRGAAEKVRLTDRFLARKLAEYDALHAELTGSDQRQLLGPPQAQDRNDAAQPRPHPGTLRLLRQRPETQGEAADLPSWDLTPRQMCDLELLMNGGFNPLKGFLTEADYDGVVETMRLADGTLWPMPITLDVSARRSPRVEPGQDIALRDPEGVILAVMSVTDKWTPDKAREAEKVFGADDRPTRR